MNDMPERLPSRPLRNWFLAWHIHTGDPADVIAKGFDLDPMLVADLLRGEVSLMVPTDEALKVCSSIRVLPGRLWPQLPPSFCGWQSYGESGPPQLEILVGKLERGHR